MTNKPIFFETPQERESLVEALYSLVKEDQNQPLLQVGSKKNLKFGEELNPQVSTEVITKSNSIFRTLELVELSKANADHVSMYIEDIIAGGPQSLGRFYANNQQFNSLEFSELVKKRDAFDKNPTLENLEILLRHLISDIAMILKPKDINLSQYRKRVYAIIDPK